MLSLYFEFLLIVSILMSTVIYYNKYYDLFKNYKPIH